YVHLLVEGGLIESYATGDQPFMRELKQVARLLVKWNRQNRLCSIRNFCRSRRRAHLARRCWRPQSSFARDRSDTHARSAAYCFAKSCSVVPSGLLKKLASAVIAPVSPPRAATSTSLTRSSTSGAASAESQ